MHDTGNFLHSFRSVFIHGIKINTNNETTFGQDMIPVTIKYRLFEAISVKKSFPHIWHLPRQTRETVYTNAGHSTLEGMYFFCDDRIITQPLLAERLAVVLGHLWNKTMKICKHPRRHLSLGFSIFSLASLPVSDSFCFSIGACALIRASPRSSKRLHTRRLTYGSTPY